MKRFFTIKYFLVIIVITLSSLQLNAQVVISQVYGGAGCGTAGCSTFKNDFIELFNRSAAPVSLNGWSVQYAAATGTAWQVTALTNVTLQPGQYYLVAESFGTNGVNNIPTPDVTGTIAMSATAGKIALVNSTTALSGSQCPTMSPSIIDFIGYGATANCSETAPAPAPSTTNADIRAGNGCTDAGNNSTDFSAAAANPRNTATTLNPCGGASISIAAGTAAAEPATAGTFVISFSPATTGVTTVNYAFAGTSTFSTDYSVTLDAGATPTPLVSSNGTITIPASVSSVTVTINPVNDGTSEGTETIQLTLSSPSPGYGIGTGVASINLVDDDPMPALISQIQGSGSNAIAGYYVTSGVVTGVYPTLSPAGFYIQSQSPDADVNTSEGIFVVSNAVVAYGDVVEVTGTAQENGSSPSFNQAVLHTTSVVIISAGNPLPASTTINLPVMATTEYEKFEGMLVNFPQTLTVSDNQNLGSFGEVSLSQGGLVYTPTQVIDPNDDPASGTNSSGTSNVAAINALVTSNALRTILLDDGRGTLPSLPYVDGNNTLRVGSTITNISGILGFAFSQYRIQPSPSFSSISFTHAARPSVPATGGNLKVVSFNVLNYFNGNGAGGGFPTSRGADSPAEFARQRDKIINALVQMNADVVGLIEMENLDENDGVPGLLDLVNGINAILGPGTYSIIDDDLNNDGSQDNNTDQIRCAIIYKSAVVTPVGAAMLGTDAVFDRPPLAQTFKLVSNEKVFNFVVNHFKSKGGCPGSGVDADQLDGQACFNNRRKLQSNALLSFFNSVVIPASGSHLILSVGDYNSYYEEDPMDILRAGGYTVLSSSGSYSYLFDGQVGALDHAIANSSLAGAMVSIEKWNSNSVEPTFLDYEDGIDDGGDDIVNPWSATYTVSPWRASDHDAIVMSFLLDGVLPVSLTNFMATKQNTSSKLSWTTSQEINSSMFVIERSPDGMSWQTIGNVTASGTTSSQHSYTMYDMNPVKGLNFYRLKIVDRDNQFSYSDTRRVDFGSRVSYTLYPNPVTERLLLTVDNGDRFADVEILNAQSQRISSQRINLQNQPASIPVTSLQSGVYFLRIISPDGSSTVEKFIKK